SAVKHHLTAREHPDEHVRDDLAVADDDLLDLRAQRLEGGDERLDPSVTIHRALLSLVQPTRRAISSCHYREPSSARARGVRNDDSFILLDRLSKIAAKWRTAAIRAGVCYTRAPISPR